MVLSFATASAGGIIRDLLIGAVPPQAIRDWRYAGVAFAAGVFAFFFHHFVRQVPSPVAVGLDAAGLALFAVSGAGKALAYGLHPFMAILMGTITGVGCGTARDVLLARVPSVLRVDVYAVAALAGSAFMIAGLRLGMPRALVTILGAVVCFVLRVVSLWQHWNLPRAVEL
jgi:uncharacterized membrane protein YeiH